MSRPGILVVAVMLAVSACGNDESRREWTDLPSEFGAELVSNAAEVVATEDYRLLIGDAPPRYGSERFRCVQLDVGGEGIGCLEVGRDDGSSGGHSASVRSGDQRIIWSGKTIEERPESTVDHFVVWSSASPDGRRIESIEVAGTTNLIWVMEPGEAPWGFQSIAADGSLIQAQPLVGLPDR